MHLKMVFNIKSAVLENVPFEHFEIKNAISDELQIQCLQWFENEAPWKLIETDFYEQYEFSLLDDDFPMPIAWLSAPETINFLRSQIAMIFGVSLKDDVEVTAHRLVSGQTIRIHNDFIPGAETHRLLLQINKEWFDEYGGQLMLFSGPEPELLCKIISPISGSIQGFAISPDSHHAVSTVHGGDRFTVVYSFFSH